MQNILKDKKKNLPQKKVISVQKMSNRFPALIVLWAVDEVRLVPGFQMTRYYGTSLSNLTVLNSYLNFSPLFSRLSCFVPCASSKDRNENPLV